MIVLSGKSIRPFLKSDIEEKLSKTSLSFYLYVDPENPDCMSYLKSIEKLLDSFSIPYQIGYYDRAKSLVENLSVFSISIHHHSVLLLRPLPIKEEKKFIDLIPPSQDADMLTDINRGRLFAGTLDYLPATAQSIRKILSFYQIPLKDKNAVVLGRSLSLGLPCFELLNRMDSNVTLLHSRTSDEKREKAIRNADVLLLCTGRSGLLKKEWLKKGVVVIDAGYSSNHGDLGFAPEEEEDIAYTPVPGGVGALTSYCLLLNALNLRAK